MFSFSESEEVSDGRTKLFVVCSCDEGLNPAEDVWLFDHAWTFRSKQEAKVGRTV